MSWIKDNQFIATLGGITLVGVAGLVVVGLQFSGRYEQAQASYEEQTAIVNDAEGLPLYPTTPNKQGKVKAVADYKAAVEGLQAACAKFRPEATANIPPQEFTNRLQAANTEVLAAFEANKSIVPGTFFLGFENYSGTLARSTATGVLDFQLGASKELLLALGQSNVSALINVHRPKLVEEDGGTFTAQPGQVARAMPVEISFKASEPAARAFFSSIAKSDKYYYVVRSLRISNERKTAPVATDAKFEASAPLEEAAPAAGGGFALPEDPAQPAADAAPAPEAAPAAEPAPVDTGRILSQVLGSEEIYVFVRIDIMQFLPTKPL